MDFWEWIAVIGAILIAVLNYIIMMTVILTVFIAPFALAGWVIYLIAHYFKVI